jgi:hypothetical protein
VDAITKSRGPSTPMPVISFYGERWVIWFQVFVAGFAILAMEAKAIHRFMGYSGAASETGLLNLVLTSSYLLVIVALVGSIFLTMRRYLTTLPQGSAILRRIVFQGLLLLNLVLIAMDVMRF